MVTCCTVLDVYKRQGAHTVSDEVFEKLTGIRGAFRTRIAYVVQKNGGSQPYEAVSYTHLSHHITVFERKPYTCKYKSN